MKIETLAINAGRGDLSGSGAVMPGIQPSTTFHRGNEEGFVYSRLDNPNRRALEACMCRLEQGKEAMAFSSGMAAVNAIFQSMSAGDHILLADDTYYGVRQLAASVFDSRELGFTLVDMTDPESILSAIRPETRLIWVETPSNPMLKITDIAAVADIAHRAGSVLCVDSTWATPVLQQPLALGADFVLHSSTKYLGGHSDLLGGIVVARESCDLSRRIRNVQQTAGAVPGAFDVWLLLRGIRTLPVRMRAHCENAARIVDFLKRHADISHVFYPGLQDHPGHDIAERQMAGYGGMISMRHRGGAAGAEALAASTRLFIEATSLGGVESLIEHRAKVEGPDSMTPDDLVRISVGLEHASDLAADLDQALSKKARSSP